MPHPREIADKDFHKKFEWPVRTCMQNGRALSLVNDGMRGQRNFVLSVVKLNGDALRLAAPDLKDDYEVARTAIQQDGMAVRFASERLRMRHDFMMDAFKRETNALRYASRVLLHDASFMLEAVKHSSAAISFFPDELKADREFMEVAMETCAHKDLLQHASSSLQDDLDFVSLCVGLNGLALEHADRQFKDKKEIVLTAVQQNGLALEFASKRLIKNKEIVLAAVTQDPAALVFAPIDLRKSRDVLLAATRGQPQLDERLAALLGIRARAMGAPAEVLARRKNLAIENQRPLALENQRPSSAATVSKGNSPASGRPSSALRPLSGVRPSVAIRPSSAATSPGNMRPSSAATGSSAQSVQSKAPNRIQLMRQKKLNEERQWRETLLPPEWGTRLTQLCEDNHTAMALATRTPSGMLEAEIRGDDSVINAITRSPSKEKEPVVPIKPNLYRSTTSKYAFLRSSDSEPCIAATADSPDMTRSKSIARMQHSPTQAGLEENQLTPAPQKRGLGMFSPFSCFRSSPNSSPSKSKSGGKADSLATPTNKSRALSPASRPTTIVPDAAGSRALSPVSRRTTVVPAAAGSRAVSPVSRRTTVVPAAAGSPTNDKSSTPVRFALDCSQGTKNFSAANLQPMNIDKMQSINRSVSIGRTERTVY